MMNKMMNKQINLGTLIIIVSMCICIFGFSLFFVREHQNKKIKKLHDENIELQTEREINRALLEEFDNKLRLNKTIEIGLIQKIDSISNALANSIKLVEKYKTDANKLRKTIEEKKQFKYNYNKSEDDLLESLKNKTK